MCIGIIKYLIAVLIASILIAGTIIMLWFAFGLMINFYKIFLKSKSKSELKNKKECAHDHIVHDKANPEYPFACSACGKRF